MSKLPTDHIWVALVAFLAVLAAFTTITIIGTDPSASATLRDVMLTLAGVLGGLAVGKAITPPK